MIINLDFQRKRAKDSRLPPGQYETGDFPVLSFGPTPVIKKENWKLEVGGLVENKLVWDWKDFNDLPQSNLVADIHCVTKWSKFDTNWSGVYLDELISRVGLKPEARYITAYSYDGYTTNLPLKDVINMQAMVAIKYAGKDIEPKHGGPVRLLVPHLYFWKSAKWLTKIEFIEWDNPGFWETRGYHNYGNPWKEQRYTLDE